MLNQEYAKEEIEEIFETKFGARIKGITLRRWNDNTPYILLFSKQNGPYDDRIEGDTFYYDGEGLDKDQELTVANKALMNSNVDTRVIYGFIQENQSNKWKFVGLLKVLGYDYVLKNDFKKYVFKIQKTLLESSEEISTDLVEKFGTRRNSQSSLQEQIKADVDDELDFMKQRIQAHYNLSEEEAVKLMNHAIRELFE